MAGHWWEDWGSRLPECKDFKSFEAVFTEEIDAQDVDASEIIRFLMDNQRMPIDEKKKGLKYILGAYEKGNPLFNFKGLEDIFKSHVDGQGNGTYREEIRERKDDKKYGVLVFAEEIEKFCEIYKVKEGKYPELVKQDLQLFCKKVIVPKEFQEWVDGLSSGSDNPDKAPKTQGEKESDVVDSSGESENENIDSEDVVDTEVSDDSKSKNPDETQDEEGASGVAPSVEKSVDAGDGNVPKDSENNDKKRKPLSNEDMYAYLIETGKDPIDEKNNDLKDEEINGLLESKIKELSAEGSEGELKNKLNKILKIRKALSSQDKKEYDYYDFKIKYVSDLDEGFGFEELTDPFGRKFYAKTENYKTTVYDSTGNIAECRGKKLEGLSPVQCGYYLRTAYAGVSNDVIKDAKKELTDCDPSEYTSDRDKAIRNALEKAQTNKWLAKINNNSETKDGTEFRIGQGTAKIDGGALMVDDQGEVEFVLDQGNEATFTNVYGGAFNIEKKADKFLVSWTENGVKVSKTFDSSKTLAKMLVAGLEKMEKDYDREVESQTSIKNPTPTPSVNDVLNNIVYPDAEDELAFKAKEENGQLSWTFGKEKVELKGACFDQDGNIRWPQGMQNEDNFKGYLRLKTLEQTGWKLEEPSMQVKKSFLSKQKMISIRQNSP